VAGTVHVIGAGMAGLAAAVRLARDGRAVALYEAAGQAGGRCRSFFDPATGRVIDNGNHLVLSGNAAIADYLATIGAGDRLTGPERAEFPFLDLRSGERWTLRPSAGRLPWWIWSGKHRVPGTQAGDYLRGVRLAFAGEAATVAACVGNGVALQRFWEPLTVAVLNAAPQEAAAGLLWPVLRETFGRGEAACRPRQARRSLADCFVDPALSFLGRAGAAVRVHCRLRSLAFDGDRVVSLDLTGGERVVVAPGDAVVLAVPAPIAAELVPRLSVPQGHRAIVNGHFRLAEPRGAAAPLGLVGGLCQWLFVRDDVASVTVSAADALLDTPAEVLAERMWQEVGLALNLGLQPLPAHRIVKEKRATFLQVPAEIRRRPSAVTGWRNLFLAGDWTATGLPATIEGSVRSGHTAAAKVQHFLANT
jgi:squalene-associated FAD-dependent desaturase